jgi:hypothetical protein
VLSQGSEGLSCCCRLVYRKLCTNISTAEVSGGSVSKSCSFADTRSHGLLQALFVSSSALLPTTLQAANLNTLSIRSIPLIERHPSDVASFEEDLDCQWPYAVRERPEVSLT